MRVKNIHLQGYRRFTDLKIEEIPESVRLIVLAGPNGTGKSSFFDGLKSWHVSQAGVGGIGDDIYFRKVGLRADAPHAFNVETHDRALDDTPEGRKKWVYVRTAFRHDADFNVSSFSRLQSPLDIPRVHRMIDVDASIADNYQRMVMSAVEGIFSQDGSDPAMTVGQLRDSLIQEVGQAFSCIFSDLKLVSVGNLLDHGKGTFFFEKGTASSFPYKNLSAGEKAVFDLLVDVAVKRRFFDNTLWCIDEPENHLNTRVQAQFMDELLGLLPTGNQLLLATHSIGFMRRAWELYKDKPGEVVFLDFQGHNFDDEVILAPIKPSREFWQRTLEVALGDLAKLLAPERVVLCEGRPQRGKSDKRGEFDAKCYRTIFAEEYPTTDWLSVGNSHEVGTDKVELGKSIQTIVSGTAVIRLVDQDLKSKEEIADLQGAGVRVLQRRHIESYLLDEEVLDALCDQHDKSHLKQQVRKAYADAIAASISRGNDPDDVKSASGEAYVSIRKLLDLRGSNFEGFAVSNLAPLIKPGMAVYQELRDSIFGS